MRGKKPLPDYEAPGSGTLTMQANTVAAIQQVVGGLVLPYTEPEATDVPDDAQFSPIQSPVELGRVLGTRATALKEGVEGWKKQTARLLAQKQPPRPAVQASALLSTLLRVKTDCLNIPALLAQVGDALGMGLQAMEPGRTVYLGVPAPLPDEDIAGAAAQWESALSELGAMDAAQDPELPALVARSAALADEILTTLREAGKVAKWLWTNQPSADKLVELVQWIWDLHCECQEMATCCGCLKPGIEHWVSVLRGP